MNDLRIAIRTMRATPIVTLVVILSLALGIGANTAMFSIVNSLLLRALPVESADRGAEDGLHTAGAADTRFGLFSVRDVERARAERVSALARARRRRCDRSG